MNEELNKIVLPSEDTQTSNRKGNEKTLQTSVTLSRTGPPCSWNSGFQRVRALGKAKASRKDLLSPGRKRIKTPLPGGSLGPPFTSEEEAYPRKCCLLTVVQLQFYSQRMLYLFGLPSIFFVCLNSIPIKIKVGITLPLSLFFINARHLNS